MDDDEIRAVVKRLSRPHPSGGEVIERRSQVDEGGVGRAQELGQLRDRRGEGDLLAPERSHHQFQVMGQEREVGGPLGERAREMGGVDQQALEGRRVEGQLADPPPRRREERVGVVKARVGGL